MTAAEREGGATAAERAGRWARRARRRAGPVEDPGTTPDTTRGGTGCGPARRSGYAQRVDPKTRNRIMSGLLAVLLIVVVVAAAMQ
ncbi:hypothetical protein [Streptomyces sp. NPDC053560]|uniref:hypothetical protein n=1 Tax=Streptomyces sp. NPDC053560 TaxID=3365711 RepID=UPI0037D91C98